MKYIWYIVAFVASFTILIASVMIDRQPAKKIVAISVNNKQISRDEYNQQRAAVHASDERDFINSLVVRELMIQAAQKQGIDKDESFRRTIQDYYEQTLIKQVMDKKIKSIQAAITETEIDTFALFQGSTIKLTIFKSSDENAAKNGLFSKKMTKTVPAHDLAGEVSDRLEVLKVGERTTPFCSESGCEVFQLDAIIPASSRSVPSAASRNTMRATLLERKKQRVLDEWIADLKAKADIKVLLK